MSRAVAGVGGMCPTIKPGTNRGTQRILDRMDDSKTYLTVTFTKMDSWTASRLEPDVSYADINFKTGSRPRVRTDRAGLNSTYSELNFRKEEHRIDEDEDPPITSGPGGLPTTDKTGNMGNERPATRDRSDSRTWLICVLTTALVITGICWWIHVSQIRQSMITSDRNCTETGRKDRSVNEIKAQICNLFSSKKGMWPWLSCTRCLL
ncbi:uncharacterized protein [Mobula birostris]|uniref:uncharacterized protein n=1 Tax=Mobula birostris TaxID=1983395 RepID=UPI003B280365